MIKTNTKEENIKYFTSKELSLFMNQLEKNRLTAHTTYAIKTTIRNEALFKVMYYCALRVSEVTQLKVNYYNTANNELFCPRIKGGQNNTLKIIDENIIDSLNRQLSLNQPKKFLFENMKAGEETKLSRITLDKIMKKICVQAHLENTEKNHCHTLRHTRAIILAEQNFDLKELQYWLGHKDISNTMIYFQFTSTQQAPMYIKLSKNDLLINI